MQDDVMLYKAKTIVTMDDKLENATHVAVANGLIQAVGGVELESQFGTPDSRFADFVLTPGFVEGHAHAMEGIIWKLPYVGFYDRTHPEGHKVTGCQSVSELVERLRELERDLPNEQTTLFAWGYDSIYFSDKPMRQDLDKVSGTRPVVVFHSNLHLITVNSVALNKAKISKETVISGVYTDDQGEPNGELAEFAAMFPIFRAVGDPIFGGMADVDGLRRFGMSCHRAGITTSSDLYNDLDEDIVRSFQEATCEPDFPVRIVPALGATQKPLNDLVSRSQEITSQGNDKLYMGSVKIITDGSIQGYSARVRQPYVNGVENGVWYEPPARLQELIRTSHTENIKLHIHVNGDESAELVLQTFESIVEQEPLKQLHVLQHAQMMDTDQLQRAAKLGLMVNMFANHTYYWGDQHRDATVGPSIAPRMNAARTALDCGMELAIHCDAPVSPMGPLFTAWCAVCRQTASGRDHGLDERITPAEALRAITLGPAISMDLADKVGSIEVGKFADFTVLKDSPLDVEPMQIKDIEVLGTMLSGRWQPAS